ncbi:MAG: hypothetical protein H6744_11605 [Deltaproteobacteria bacterium]|nr:hypothetical protein [Deltaproteobacteria bacterium]MCB9787322.1 hypothetical protein [Deltaproteobacteria bacterium]
MAQSDSQVISTHIAVSGGMAQITMGDTRISVAVGNIEPLIRILQAARLIAGQGADYVASPGAEQAAATPPRRATVPTARAAAVSPPPARRAGTSKRRSRKRVGDALEVWMQQNPGWHSEAELLQAVVDNRMTDASPKRALKIALGKQRDELFEGDGNGHWKLVRDADAGAPPKPSARKSKGKSKSKAKGAARGTAAAVAQRGRVARAAEEATSAERAGETAARRGARVRLKTRPRTMPHPVPTAPPESGEGEGEGAAAAEARPSGPKRVKKGERQKAARAAEAKPSTETGVERWRGFSRDDVERARKNLLGVGSGTGVRGAGEEESG